MASKWASIAIGGELPTAVTVGDSDPGEPTIALRIPLATSDPAMSRQDLLNAVEAIKMRLIQATFPVT
jgi:hypothetical protein